MYTMLRWQIRRRLQRGRRPDHRSATIFSSLNPSHGFLPCGHSCAALSLPVSHPSVIPGYLHSELYLLGPWSVVRVKSSMTGATEKLTPSMNPTDPSPRGESTKNTLCSSLFSGRSSLRYGALALESGWLALQPSASFSLGPTAHNRFG